MNPMTVMMEPVGAWLLFYLAAFVATFLVFFAVTGIAFSRVKRTIPTPESWKRCKIYRTWINHVSGIVHHEGRDFTWRFDPARLPRKNDCLFYDAEGQELLRIHRHRRFPPQFQVVEAGTIIGTIRLRSILLNKYTLELLDGPTWTFTMPLYTVHFRGSSNAGDHIPIRMGPSKRQWNILAPPDFDDLRIIAAIAFIHRRWYL